MSYERMMGMGTNGTSNVSGRSPVRLLAHPILTLKRPSSTPSVPSVTDWPMFNGGGATPSTPSSTSDEEPSSETGPEPSFLTTQESSPLPWIIGIGAVAAVGIGGFFLWRFLTKEEEPRPAAPAAPPAGV